MRPRPHIGSWFAGAVICKTIDGELFFLVQTSKTILPEYAGQKDQTKFPGGGNEAEDVDFFATLKRELFDETGLSLKVDVEPPVIHRVWGKSDRDKTKLHLKVFYFIPFESLQGTLRTEEIVDGTSVLSTPIWISIKDLDDTKGLYKTHRTAMRNAVEHLILRG